MEAFLDFERRGADPRRRHLDRRVRALHADARPARSSTRSPPTTRRTASPRASCATGCSSGGRRRSRSSGRSRCPSRRSRRSCGRSWSSARSCARRCSRRADELAAQLLDYHDRERKPVWWAFFDRVEQTPEELVEDAEAIGLLEPGRRARAGRALLRLAAHLPAAGAQARRRPPAVRRGKGGTRARSSRSTARRGRSRCKRGPTLEEVELPRGAAPRRAVPDRRRRRTR